MSKVRVNGIGIREAGLHLRAKRKGKKRYISMGVPSDLAQDISAIFKKEYRPSNQFMYDLLELVNEKVKFLDIDELKSKYYTSTLHFSDSKLSPVQPSAGIKTCLISGGEIRIDKKLLRNIKDAELIDFNEIVQYKSEKKKISLNKKEYTKFNFDDVGNVTLIIELIPPITTVVQANAVVYKHLNDRCGFIVPQSELAMNVYEKKQLELHPEVGEGLKLDEYLKKLEKIEKHDELSIVDHLLQKGKIRITDVYLEALADIESIGGFDLLAPETAVVELKQGKKKTMLQTSTEIAIGLGIVYLDRLWVKKKGAKKKVVEKETEWYIR